MYVDIGREEQSVVFATPGKGKEALYEFVCSQGKLLRWKSERNRRMR
jgi:hypothetical protein